MNNIDTLDLDTLVNEIVRAAYHHFITASNSGGDKGDAKFEAWVKSVIVAHIFRGCNMSFFDGNYDVEKDFFEEEAEEVLQNYIKTWNERPGIVEKAIYGISKLWKNQMIKADLAMSQFLSGMRIKPETKIKLYDKFQEIYPEMCKLLG